MKMTAFRKHMKKEMILLLAAAALMLSACGGSSEGDTEETTAASAQQAAAGSMDPAYAAMAGEIAAVDPKRPDSLGEISLGEYKGIDIEAEEAAQVTNDEAIAFIETNILPYYLEETGEPAAEGDTVTIDFAGTMDGVAFDGGTVEEGELVGRLVLIGGTRYRVTANTATSMTLEDALTGSAASVTASDNDVIYPGEGGAEGCALYACTFLGKNAYGIIKPTAESLKMIVKQRGSAGTADPLDQRSTVGWKASHAAKILYEERLLRLEVGSSYSGVDFDQDLEEKYHGGK